MLFSILIPVYNVEKYLNDCINSILSQDYSDYEVVLIDDGSTDNSGKMCDEYSLKYSNISVFHQENQGLIAARRNGIRHAAGDFCLFCDSDDFFELDTLSSISKVISEWNPDVVIFNSYLYKDNIKSIFNFDVLENGLVSNKNLVFDNLCLSEKLNSLCMKAVRRQMIDVNADYSKFYGCNYGEDLLQSLPIIYNARKIYYLNKPLYNYRLLTGMMSHYSKNYYKSYRNVNVVLEEYMQRVHLDQYQEKCAYHLLKAAFISIAQLKYKDNVQTDDITPVTEDERFARAYKLVYRTIYYLRFTRIERLVLRCLYKKEYSIVKILIKLRKLSK